MNEFERFEQALRAAEVAGDVQGARALASDMRKLMQSQNPSLGQPEDPRIEASKMAAKGTGIPEALLIGAGRTTDKVVAGAQQAQLAGQHPAPQWLPPLPPWLQDEMRERPAKLAAEQRDKDIAYSGLQKERPFATAIGESAPYAATAFLPMGLASQSALVGGAEASKYGTPEERAQRGVIGAGLNMIGGGLGKFAGGLIASGRGVSATQRTALDSMKNIGVEPRMSQVTGSPFLSRVEDWAARTPGGAGVMAKFDAANQAAVNRAAAKGIGETAEELSPEVLAAASQRMGKVFESIKTLGGKPIQVGVKVGSAADDILRQQGKLPPQLQDATLVQLANQAKTVAAHRGKIDGEAYQLIRSGLSNASFEASGSNKVLYGKLLEALDDSADASLRSAGHASIADALKTVRPQYGNLKTLEKGAVAEGGNVSPARLASAMRTNNPAAFREGRMAGNPLYDVARMGEAFKPLRQGSQTYERTLMSNPVSTTLGAAMSYPAAQFATSPLAQFWPRYIGGTQLAGLLAQGANPAIRAGTMGLLQPSAASLLLPIMSE